MTTALAATPDPSPRHGSLSPSPDREAPRGFHWSLPGVGA
jgi:hypothetical protein